MLYVISLSNAFSLVSYSNPFLVDEASVMWYYCANFTVELFKRKSTFNITAQPKIWVPYEGCMKNKNCILGRQKSFLTQNFPIWNSC